MTTKILGRLAAILIMTMGANLSIQAQKATPWKIDNSHSSVNFSINHFFSEVPGKFKEFSGDINFSQSDLKNSNASFTIQVSSVDTDDEMNP